MHIIFTTCKCIPDVALDPTPAIWFPYFVSLPIFYCTSQLSIAHVPLCRRCADTGFMKADAEAYSPWHPLRNSQSRCKSYTAWLCGGEGRSQLPVRTDPLWGLPSPSHHSLKALFDYQMQTWWPRLSTAGPINTEPQKLLTIFSGKTREPSIELWLQNLHTAEGGGGWRRGLWFSEGIGTCSLLLSKMAYLLKTFFFFLVPGKTEYHSITSLTVLELAL